MNVSKIACRSLLIAVSSAGVALACGDGGSSEDQGSTDTDAGTSADGTGEGGDFPPPTIEATTPIEGPYGMVVTLQGSLLAGDAQLPARLATLEQGAVTRCCIEQSDPAVVSWTDTQIDLRWPFPLTGVPIVQTAGGLVPGEEILPSWIPGAPIEPLISPDAPAFFHFTPAHDALVMLWLEGNRVHGRVITEASAVEHEALLGEGQLRSMSFVERADEVDIYLLLAAYGQNKAYRVQLGPEGSSVQEIVTHGGPLNDDLLTGGLDADFRVVWVRDQDDALVRYRETGPDTWELDRGPIAVPVPFASAHQASLHDSGDLLVTWAEGLTPMAAVLPAGADVFDAPEIAGGDAAMALARSRSRTNAEGVTLATWCDGTGVSWADPASCITRVRDASGAWSVPPAFEGSEASGTVVYALDDAGVIAGYCDDDGLHVTGDAGVEASEIAVWPCDPGDPAGLLARGEDGKLRALVRDSSGEEWFARER